VHRPPKRPEEKQDTPELLDQTHVALRKLLIERQIDEGVYAKNVVALAMRWLIIGRIEDANAMLCELTLEYVTKDLPEQMETDEDFRAVAHAVAQGLGSLPMDLDEDDVHLAALLVERPVAKA
jgi:hypothetical protein